MLTQEQIAETRKANLDALFELANTAIEGVQKLTALNLQTIRATLADTLDLTQQSLSAKEAQEWLALQNKVALPMADRVQTYCRQAFDIVSATQAEHARIGKAQCEAYGRQMKSVVMETPAGSEAAMTALDSAITAARTLYEPCRAAVSRRSRHPQQPRHGPQQPRRTRSAQSIPHCRQRSDNDRIRVRTCNASAASYKGLLYNR
ncbi:phasin family protein [Paraburkholderia terrae]